MKRGSPWKACAMVQWEAGLNQEQPKEAGKIDSEDKVGDAIEALTAFLTETSKTDFSQNSIVIELTSPHVADLTLIDVP